RTADRARPRRKNLRVQVPVLLAEVRPHLPLGPDVQLAAAANGVDEGVVPVITIEGMHERDVSMAREHSSVRVKAEDLGFELEAAQVAALVNLLAVGVGHAKFERRLNDGTDKP